MPGRRSKPQACDGYGQRRPSSGEEALLECWKVRECREKQCRSQATMMVPTMRLELIRPKSLPPQDSVSTNFTTSAVSNGPGWCNLPIPHLRGAILTGFRVECKGKFEVSSMRFVFWQYTCGDLWEPSFTGRLPRLSIRRRIAQKIGAPTMLRQVSLRFPVGARFHWAIAASGYPPPHRAEDLRSHNAPTSLVAVSCGSPVSLGDYGVWASAAASRRRSALPQCSDRSRCGFLWEPGFTGRLQRLSIRRRIALKICAPKMLRQVSLRFPVGAQFHWAIAASGHPPPRRAEDLRSHNLQLQPVPLCLVLTPALTKNRSLPRYSSQSRKSRTPRCLKTAMEGDDSCTSNSTTPSPRCCRPAAGAESGTDRAVELSEAQGRLRTSVTSVGNAVEILDMAVWLGAISFLLMIKK